MGFGVESTGEGATGICDSGVTESGFGMAFGCTSPQFGQVRSVSVNG